MFPQSQTFVPSGFSNADEDKHQVRLGDSQDLAPEDLVPPLPLTESLPSVFPPQNFLPQRPNPATKQDTSLAEELANLPEQDFKNDQLLQQRPNLGNVGQIEENQRQGAKQIKESSQVGLVSQSEGGQDEDEEVCTLVEYVNSMSFLPFLSRDTAKEILRIRNYAAHRVRCSSVIIILLNS